MKKGIFSDFCVLLNHSVKMEYISKNPLISIDNFKDPYESKKEMDFYSAEEFMKFISIAKGEAERYELKTSSIFEWNFYVFFM